MSTTTLWVYHFPNCITLPCARCNLSLTQHHLLQHPTTVSFHLSRGHFDVRASQTNNTGSRIRKSRRLKSDTEICTDIRQFLASVGLPVDHIPSTKELLHHGRNDLANIVRRRGHKRIQDLLTSSLHVDIDSLNTEKVLDERLDATNDCEDLLTGQNEKLDSVAADVMPSTEFLQGNSSGNMHITDSTQRFDECTSIPVESLANLSVKDDLEERIYHAEEVKSMADGSFHPTEASTVDNDCSSSREGIYPNFDSHSSIPTEISGESPLETVWSGTSECEEDISVGEIAGDVNFPLEDDLEELKDHAEKVKSVAEGSFHPSETSNVDNDCSSSTEGLYPNFDNQSSKPTEISGESPFETVWSGNLECEEDNSVGKIVGEVNFPLAVPSVENHSDTSFRDSNLDTGDKGPSFDLYVEQKDQGAFGRDDSNNNITEDVPTTSEFSENKIDTAIHWAGSSGVDTSFSLSLEEKVANFLQNGDLDPVEDRVSVISNGDDSLESKACIESKPIGDMPIGVRPPKDKNVKSLSGNSLTSNQVASSGKSDQSLWDDHDHMPREDLITHFDKDLDAEAPKVQNQSEINHLKFMLYQKELELSQLKEQIEMEKVDEKFLKIGTQDHALSVLQTKAEEEILKARKLISEKDAELHVAEESLSELKEVKIDFYSDGDVVEVAGSFNGWHNRIKMDPQPSTSDIDHDGSREPRLWSTMLWLYPGVYEIKFVVDGNWRADPQLESVSRGHICNNILRVDR